MKKILRTVSIFTMLCSAAFLFSCGSDGSNVAETPEEGKVVNDGNKSKGDESEPGNADNDNDTPPGDNDNGMRDEEVDIVDYAVEEQFWKDMETDRVHIVRSPDEFEEFHNNGLTAQAIDFEKNSLLLVQGHTPNGINLINRMLESNDKAHFVLSIDIRLDFTDVVQRWTVAVLTPVMPEGAEVRLKQEYYY